MSPKKRILYDKLEVILNNIFVGRNGLTKITIHQREDMDDKPDYFICSFNKESFSQLKVNNLVKEIENLVKLNFPVNLKGYYHNNS